MVRPPTTALAEHMTCLRKVLRTQKPVRLVVEITMRIRRTQYSRPNCPAFLHCLQNIALVNRTASRISCHL